MTSRGKTIALAASAIGAVTAAALLFFVDPAHSGLYPSCAFHRITGLNCPACGSLRALHQLGHGHFAAAWQLNAFVVASLPLWGWLGLRMLRGELKGKPAPSIRALWVWLYLGAWLLFGVLRNLPLIQRAGGAY